VERQAMLTIGAVIAAGCNGRASRSAIGPDVNRGVTERLVKGVSMQLAAA
jgi:hypothetical protein